MNDETWTLIPLLIRDGALQFDHERLDETTDDNLRSWLENVAPEDLFSGTKQILISAQVHWSGDEAPQLLIDPPEGGSDGE